MGDKDFIVPEVSLQKRLGGGAFGSVWLGKGKRWSYSAQKFIKDQFAVKKLPKGEGSTFTEIEIHNVLGRHPTISFLYDWMEKPPDGDRNNIWLVYEFCDSGSINDLLLKKSVSISTMLDYFQDITSALVFLHQHRVVHLDIKSDNILLCQTKHGLTCKVCDFGIARILSEDGRDCYKVTTLSRSCGPWYSSAPELFRGSKMTDKSDIFSLGLLMLAFFTRSHVKVSDTGKLVTPFLNYRGREGTPFHKATQDEIYHYINSNASSRLRSILKKMLQRDYHNRPFAEEVLESLEKISPSTSGKDDRKGKRVSKRIQDNQSIISGGYKGGQRGHQRRIISDDPKRPGDASGTGAKSKHRH